MFIFLISIILEKKLFLYLKKTNIFHKNNSLEMIKKNDWKKVKRKVEIELGLYLNTKHKIHKNKKKYSRKSKKKDDFLND